MAYSSGRGAGASFIKFIVTIAALAAVSFGVAFFWQRAEDSLLVSAAADESSAASESEGVSTSSSSEDDEYRDIYTETSGGEPTETATPASSGETGDGEDEDGEAVGAPSAYTREAVSGAVAISKPVGYDYFNDAIFFGDSISTGIPLYMQTMIPDPAVIAAQGVSPGGALTSQCINSGGSRVTMLQAAKEKGERSKIYIMLGANALDLDEDSFIGGYIDFIKAVKTEYPEAAIYVQSMMPVTANVNRTYPSKNINNERITAYNAAICKMAQEQGAYYVDVAQAVVDKDGMLPADASPLDGMHLTPEYYIKWFDYLRNHTVQ